MEAITNQIQNAKKIKNNVFAIYVITIILILVVRTGLEPVTVAKTVHIGRK